MELLINPALRASEPSPSALRASVPGPLHQGKQVSEHSKFTGLFAPTRPGGRLRTPRITLGPGARPGRVLRHRSAREPVQDRAAGLAAAVRDCLSARQTFPHGKHRSVTSQTR
jgi:hypothetical protein